MGHDVDICGVAMGVAMGVTMGLAHVRGFATLCVFDENDIMNTPPCFALALSKMIDDISLHDFE